MIFNFYDVIIIDAWYVVIILAVLSCLCFHIAMRNFNVCSGMGGGQTIEYGISMLVAYFGAGTGMMLLVFLLVPQMYPV